MTEDDKPRELDAELREWEHQFQQMKLDVVGLVDGLTDAQFNWRPEPGRWSIGECLDHLNVTAERYLPLMTAAMEDARRRQLVGRGPFRYGMFESWFVRTMEPPAKRRFRAPKVFQPEGRLTRAEIVAAFQQRQTDYVAALHAADGVDLRRAKVTSPTSRLFKTSLGQSFALMAAHQRRHLWQARQVRQHREFPRT